MRYDTFNSLFHPPKLNKIFILLNFSSRKYAICSRQIANQNNYFVQIPLGLPHLQSVAYVIK